MERTPRELTKASLRGRRFHFAGSADPEVNRDTLKYAHKMIYQLAVRALSEGAGLVVTVGSDPAHKSGENLSVIFDWSILEAVDRFRNSGIQNWPKAQGTPVVAVGFGNWNERIPNRRRNMWDRIAASGKLELRVIPSELSVGGVLREQQEIFGDILVTLGGGPGVYHLAELYRRSRKSVIPLDISLKKEKPSASETLFAHATKDPQSFFEYEPAQEALAKFSRFSFRHGLLKIDEFEQRLFDFVYHLPRPTAFYVRLLNHRIPQYKSVETYFRNVADPVVESSGYRRFEMGTDASTEAFMNVETFKKLHYSSLVIADLTCIRPNCCIELGYSLGLHKRVILTARDDTKLPWDAASIRCHFWSSKESDEKRKIKLRNFMKRNINKQSVVS